MLHVLLATDSDQVFTDVDAAIGGADARVSRIRAGRDVRRSVVELEPDVVVLDLQIGSMGGLAACLDLRLEEGAGRLPTQNVLLLLDREADVFLARRSGADGWLVKPLDSFRLRKAARAVMAGGRYEEGVPTQPAG